jgi:hypothetical protein
MILLSARFLYAESTNKAQYSINFCRLGDKNDFSTISSNHYSSNQALKVTAHALGYF